MGVERVCVFNDGALSHDEVPLPTRCSHSRAFGHLVFKMQGPHTRSVNLIIEVDHAVGAPPVDRPEGTTVHAVSQSGEVDMTGHTAALERRPEGLIVDVVSENGADENRHVIMSVCVDISTWHDHLVLGWKVNRHSKVNYVPISGVLDRMRSTRCSMVSGSGQRRPERAWLQ